MTKFLFWKQPLYVAMTPQHKATSTSAVRPCHKPAIIFIHLSHWVKSLLNNHSKVGWTNYFYNNGREVQWKVSGQWPFDSCGKVMRWHYWQKGTTDSDIINCTLTYNKALDMKHSEDSWTSPTGRINCGKIFMEYPIRELCRVTSWHIY